MIGWRQKETPIKLDGDPAMLTPVTHRGPALLTGGRGVLGLIPMETIGRALLTGLARGLRVVSSGWEGRQSDPCPTGMIAQCGIRQQVPGNLDS